jgi:hypothetical protein
MGTMEQDQKEELSENAVLDLILRTLYAIRTSFSKFFIALGTVFIILGIIQQDGVFAGLSVIIGVTVILYGAIAYVAARLLL